jgi:serine/threonine-protein kinase
MLRSDLCDAAMNARFHREALAVSKLNHPNIVRVFDFGEDAGRLYLVMEYIHGRTLRELLDQDGKLAEERIAALLVQVLLALQEAHDHGVIHRDLKPENVMVSQLAGGEELVHLVDFGIAKLMSQANEHDLTGAALIGTPQCMSPEQISGARVDHRADLYAVGCLLHQLATGRPPFFAEHAHTLLLKHVNDPTPALPARMSDGREPSPVLRRLHGSLLAKDPSRRPASARAALEGLRGAVEEHGSWSTAAATKVERHSTPPASPRSMFDRLLVVFAVAAGFAACALNVLR